MKRYIVTNSKKTALVISDNLSKATDLVYNDTNVGDEIFAFDTTLNIIYAYIVIKNGFKIIENETPSPVNKFRDFMTNEDTNEIYSSIIKTFLK